MNLKKSSKQYLAQLAAVLELMVAASVNQHPGCHEMRRDDISTIIQKNDLFPSITYWTSILSYFEQHKYELSVNEITALHEESERCRAYWNSEFVTLEVSIEGEPQKTPRRIRSGLGIEQTDVTPNISEFLENMQIGGFYLHLEQA